MIALTFALPQESAALVAMLHGVEQVERGSLPVLRGNLAASEVIVLHTGVGAQLSETRVARFLERHRPQILISSGFAGGLDPKLNIGDIVFAENFSDRALLGKMRDLQLAGARIFFGTLTTQPHAAETVEEKAALFRATAALAVDMETAGIRAHCEKFSVPMLSVRAISDTASQRLPVPFPAWFDAKKQTPRIGGLLWFLARHPEVIAEFTRFARGTFRARRTLADCLALAVEAIELD